MNKVKKKLKDLKYYYLKKLYSKLLAPLPKNCQYNKTIKINNNTYNVCTFFIKDLPDLDLCYKKEHAEQCNAFCPIKTKDQIKKEFEEELLDPQLRATYYKDINILYWLYPDLQEEHQKLSPWSRFDIYLQENNIEKKLRVIFIIIVYLSVLIQVTHFILNK